MVSRGPQWQAPVHIFHESFEFICFTYSKWPLNTVCDVRKLLGAAKQTNLIICGMMHSNRDV